MHSAHKMTGRSLETCSAITVLSPKNVGILHETVFVSVMCTGCQWLEPACMLCIVHCWSSPRVN